MTHNSVVTPEPLRCPFSAMTHRLQQLRKGRNVVGSEECDTERTVGMGHFGGGILRDACKIGRYLHSMRKRSC